MTTKPDQPSILNPRYAGASAEEVAKALLRKWGESPDLPEKSESEPSDNAEAA